MTETGSWSTEGWIVTVVVVLMVYYLWVYTRLWRCGISGPIPIPLFGNIFQQMRLGLIKADAIWEKKYGKVYGMYSGHCMQVIVTDATILKSVFVKDFNQFTDRQDVVPLPELFRNGLFFLKGDKWRLTRNIMSPTFSAGKLKQMGSIINACAEKLTNNLVREAGSKEAKPVKRFLGAFTIDVIASIAFGLDIDSQDQPDEPFVKNVRSFFDRRLGPLSRMVFIISFIFPGIAPLFIKLGFSSFNRESLDFFQRTGLAIIKDRKLSSSERVDFLQLLINAEHVEDGDPAAPSRQQTSDSNQPQRKTVHRLTIDEINAQAFLFFLAGYETTASLLQYATHTLSVHPEIDEKITEEIREQLGDSEPNYDNISKLEYMDMFINETLRFYPPVTRLSRMATRDLVTEGKTIPSGAAVTIPVLQLHHDPDYYPDPETFKPERFSPENKNSINPVTYIPFGYGPRICIGMRLALVEAKIALVHILRRVRFVRKPETQVPIKWMNTGLLVPEKPIELGIELRTS